MCRPTGVTFISVSFHEYMGMGLGQNGVSYACLAGWAGEGLSVLRLSFCWVSLQLEGLSALKLIFWAGLSLGWAGDIRGWMVEPSLRLSWCLKVVRFSLFFIWSLEFVSSYDFCKTYVCLFWRPQGDLGFDSVRVVNTNPGVIRQDWAVEVFLSWWPFLFLPTSPGTSFLFYPRVYANLVLVLCGVITGGQGWARVYPVTMVHLQFFVCWFHTFRSILLMILELERPFDLKVLPTQSWMFQFLILTCWNGIYADVGPIVLRQIVDLYQKEGQQIWSCWPYQVTKFYAWMGAPNICFDTEYLVDRGAIYAGAALLFPVPGWFLGGMYSSAAGIKSLIRIKCDKAQRYARIKAKRCLRCLLRPAYYVRQLGQCLLGWDCMCPKLILGPYDNNCNGLPPNFGLPRNVYWNMSYVSINLVRSSFLYIPRVGFIVSYFWSPEACFGRCHGGMPLWMM
ncbi:hypothetical protein Hanom_Chr15g01386671 [Helianthus anomalus]